MVTFRLILSLVLYNLALPFALLVLMPSAIIKMRRRGGTPKGLLQKAGRYPSRILRQITRMERPIWIHAVSVGEANIAIKLIRELRRQAPNKEVVLSTTTDTGQQVAQRAFQDDGHIAIIYNPVDLPPVVERALHIIRPSLIILVEAEVWPNLCVLARRRHIPLALVNARMSGRSEARYRRARFFVQPIFSLLDAVCVQEPEDRARFAHIGIPEAKITYTGSIKFDPPSGPTSSSITPLRNLLQPLLKEKNSQVVLAASTFPGEESLVGQSFQVLRQLYPNLFLIVAPRHAERADEATHDLAAAGLHPVRRTSLPGGGPEHDCLVIDTTGELHRWQALATIVVIGKSFLAKGGQNPAEAAALGIPTVLGPHMENFQALVGHMLEAKGTIQLGPATELTPTLTHLLANPDQAKELGQNAKAVLGRHQGATTKSASLALSLLP